MRSVLTGVCLLLIVAGAQAAPREFEVFLKTSSGEPAAGATVNLLKRWNASLVHGEESKVLELSSAVHRKFNLETRAPKNLETIRLN